MQYLCIVTCLCVGGKCCYVGGVVVEEVLSTFRLCHFPSNFFLFFLQNFKVKLGLLSINEFRVRVGACTPSCHVYSCLAKL